MFEDEYKTIAQFSEGLYKEKGSRFISHAIPVNSLQEVKEQLEQVRKKFHDARHHCYAYRLGFDKSVMRFNDNGEPSGTAGKPIYGQIVSSDLTNILIIVTRYFGGIKLGTSGLIQAYRSAARDALEHAEIVVRRVFDQYEIEFDYTRMNEVMHLLKEEKLEQTNQDFSEHCKVVFNVRKKDSSRIYEMFSQINQVKIRFICTL